MRPSPLSLALWRDVWRDVDSVDNTLSYIGASWIEEAKRDETRERRLAKAVEMLRDGVKTPG